MSWVYMDAPAVMHPPGLLMRTVTGFPPAWESALVISPGADTSTPSHWHISRSLSSTISPVSHSTIRPFSTVTLMLHLHFHFC